MAPTLKPRDVKIDESMKSSPVIDLNVDIKIGRSKQIDEKRYKCTCCGASWNTQKNHFSKSAHPKYQSNDGYVEICNDCRDKYYYQLVEFYSGNEEHAIRQMCSEFGWIYHIDALVASRQISADRSRISHYLAKKNLGQTARMGTTYLDTIKFEYDCRTEDVIESKEQAKESETNVTATAIGRWGIGFTESDYKVLDDHYRMLKKNNPNCDSNQEIYVQQLCKLNMLMNKAIKNEDTDKFVKLTDQYSKTFTKAGLKTIQETDASADECLGVTLATISQYTPEEYYKNKSIYEDFDHIGDYFDRFVKRPLKNLMTGSKDRDHEYFVKDTRIDVDD